MWPKMSVNFEFLGGGVGGALVEACGQRFVMEGAKLISIRLPFGLPDLCSATGLGFVLSLRSFCEVIAAEA